MPEIAGPSLKEYVDKHHPNLGIRLRFQEATLNLNEEACDWAPFAFLSEVNMEELVLYDDDFMEFAEKLGYHPEMKNRYIVCFVPDDEDKWNFYVQIQKNHIANRQISSSCQRDYQRSLEMIASYPVIENRQMQNDIYSSGFNLPQGFYHFTWIKFKDFILKDGETKREFIIDSRPRTGDDLANIQDDLRSLPCVQNVWTVYD